MPAPLPAPLPDRPRPGPVLAVAIPPESRLHALLPGHHFGDAYRAQAWCEPLSPQTAYLAVFGTAPGWVRNLMRLRGVVARRLGLRHGFDGQAALPAADQPWPAQRRVGPFTVYESGADELIVGEDDRHLDFRISVLRSQAAGLQWLTVSTAVQTHNRLGRVYLALVKPLHRRIARTMLQRAAGSAAIAAMSVDRP